MELYSWTVLIGFSDGSDMAFHEYAPLLEVVEAIGDAVADGASLVKQRAEEISERGEPLVTLEVRVVPPYGGSGFWSDSPSSLDGVKRTADRLAHSAVRRATEAAGRRPAMRPPPGLEEKFGELMETIKEVAGHAQTGRSALNFVGSIAGGGGPAAAIAGAIGGEGGGAGGLITVLQKGLSNPEVVATMQELISDPTKISEALKDISDE